MARISECVAAEKEAAMRDYKVGEGEYVSSSLQ